MMTDKGKEIAKAIARKSWIKVGDCQISSANVISYFIILLKVAKRTKTTGIPFPPSSLTEAGEHQQTATESI